MLLLHLIICWELDDERFWDSIHVSVTDFGGLSSSELAELAVEQHPYLRIPQIQHVFCVGHKRQD